MEGMIREGWKGVKHRVGRIGELSDGGKVVRRGEHNPTILAKVKVKYRFLNF